MLWPVSELFWRLLFLTWLHAQLFQIAGDHGVSQDSGLWAQKPEGSPRQTRMLGHSINQGPSILTVIQLAPGSIVSKHKGDFGGRESTPLSWNPNYRTQLSTSACGVMRLWGMCSSTPLLVNLSWIKSVLYLPTMTLCVHIPLLLPKEWASEILPLTGAQAASKARSPQARGVKKEAGGRRSAPTQRKATC